MPDGTWTAESCVSSDPQGYIVDGIALTDFRTSEKTAYLAWVQIDLKSSKVYGR